MLLSVISALLYILAFPVAGFDISPWPLICIALTPLFLGLESGNSYTRTILTGAVWGAVMSLGLAYWLVYAMIWQYGMSLTVTVLFMILGLMLPHAIIYGLFAGMYRFIKENVPGAGNGLIFYTVTVPSLWVVTEFSREIISILVPWGLAGYGLQPFTIYMQVADITGIFGISFLVVMMNAIITCLIRGSSRRDGKTGPLMRGLAARMKSILDQKRPAIAVLLFIIVLPVLYGTLRHGWIQDCVRSGMADGRGIHAAAVQANFTQDERWKTAGFIERVNICLGLTEKCFHRQVAAGLGRATLDGMVVWPETVLNSRGMVNSRLFSYIQSRVGGSRLLVAGGVRRTIGAGGVYNTAFIVHGTEAPLIYDKNILLPYAETAPFGRLFGDFYTAPAEFLTGGTPPAARTATGIIGLSICFEALYPWYSRRAVNDGARLLVNLSNDGWFGRTSEPVLHLRQASVRAIENRRFMIRTSNNGYSAIISPAGELISKGGLFTRECVSGTVIMMDTRTLYARFGDWVVYAALVIILVMLIRIMTGK
jgi:apolipoprotein N-acyltransferase